MMQLINADADEGAAAGPQRITEFGTPDTGRGCHLANLFQTEGDEPGLIRGFQ